MFGPWVAAACLVATPAIAMRFTDEVAWTTSDFVFAIFMLLAVLTPWELTMRSSRDFAALAASAIALGLPFLLVWFTGAVGIIGSENNSANLMFFVVIAIALVGSVLAAFRPAGMAWAMFAAGAAQLAVGAIALIGNMGSEGESWPMDVAVLTGAFTASWLLSGALYRRSARTRARTAVATA